MCKRQKLLQKVFYVVIFVVKSNSTLRRDADVISI